MKSVLLPLLVAAVCAILFGGCGYLLALVALDQAARRDQRLLDSVASYQRAKALYDEAAATYQRLQRLQKGIPE